MSQNQLYQKFKDNYFYSDFVKNDLSSCCIFCKTKNIIHLDLVLDFVRKLEVEIEIKRDSGKKVGLAKLQLFKNLTRLEIYIKDFEDFLFRKDSLIKTENYCNFILNIETEKNTKNLCPGIS